MIVEAEKLGSASAPRPSAPSTSRASVPGKVLVLGSDNAIFLSVVRSLGRRGLDVHVAWYPPGCATLASKYITRAHRVRGYSPDGPWLEEMIALLERERFELVIPVSEQSVHPFQHHRHELERHAKIALLDDETYAIAFDKQKTYALAESAGVRVPKQLVITSPPNIERLLSELAFPIVLKPRSSYSIGSLTRRREVAKAYDRRELEAHLLRMLESGGEVLAQENFIGEGVGVEVIADRGEILFAFQHRRLHEPLQGGGSTYRISCPVDPRLLEASERLLRPLSYTGVAMIEFKVEREGRNWVFLEINSRFWGSLPLAIAAGADFPYWLYELLVRGRRDFPQQYAIGVCSRNLLGDLKWMKQNFHADREDPTLMTRPWPSVFAEVLNVARGRERIDTFALDDPRPMVAEVEHYTELYTGRLMDRLRTRLGALGPLRRSRRELARRALANAESVLFLCLGNICRSPFAHLFLSTLKPELRVTSAGFYPVPDRRSPPEALRAASSFGVSLDAHRSRIVDAAMVRDAEVIIVFDEQNMRMLLEHFPWAEWKAHRFASLIEDGPAEIEDPYGSDVDGFAACYARIAGALRAELERR